MSWLEKRKMLKSYRVLTSSQNIYLMLYTDHMHKVEYRWDFLEYQFERQKYIKSHSHETLLWKDFVKNF